MPEESEKATLRRKMNRRLESLDPDLQVRQAGLACNTLKKSLPWREARVILLYMSFGRELSADPVLDAALAEGKSVFAPAIIDGDLEFRRIRSVSGPFLSGPFGIREPTEESGQWNMMATPGPSLVLVPGLAFDESGGRLGRGAGYYDRFIERVRLEARSAGESPPLFLGYGYFFQKIKTVPMEDHDQRLDGWIAGDSLRLFG